MSNPDAAWAAQSERGSMMLVRLMSWITLSLGWRVGQVLLYPITAWFLVFSAAARAASRDFLTQALGRPATVADICRHFFVFSSVILDRLFLLTGRIDAYKFEMTGVEALHATLAEGRGCLLLGSHLGSFEVLRALAREAPVRIRALMYLDNAGALSRVLEHLNPELARDVIGIGTTATMLEVRESVARGEVVGILGDRAPKGQKRLCTAFFGKQALFPTGPLILASVLKTPTFLFFGIRTGPRRYRIHLERFADAITLHRATRQADLQHWLAVYAGRLEHHARNFPYNWFNFFDFWAPSAELCLADRCQSVGNPKLGRSAPVGPV